MSTICARARLVFSAGLPRIVLTILVVCTSGPAVIPTVDIPTRLLPAIIFSTLTSSSPSPIVLSPATSVETEVLYSFENNSSGWTAQTYYSTIACIQVSNSAETAKDGLFSLKLDMNLIGNDVRNSRGEAWVDMRYYPPPAVQIPFMPLDLNSRTITMWVYAPTGAIGDSNKPNGLQIFVKDIHWNGSYSTWINVVENEWVQLSFTVSNALIESGYMEPGFDPTQIIAVGIKMGAGGGSTAVYQGPIYIDAVDW